jgi:hypothetical protein
MNHSFRHLLLLAATTVSTAAFAQFAPQVGNPGTTAIHKDSTIIKAWATGCTIQRGWQDIADTTLGKAQVGDETYVPGPAGNGVVSLGDGGEAIITFQHPIINGAGYDFAVFENGFTDQSLDPGTAFLELAFVEVSSDGVHYVRFDATSNNDTTRQLGSFEGMDASKINNLAGKYLVHYGTPFDLEELKDAPGLDVNNITHIKIIDVVGNISNNYARRDARENKINDPWPTPFASSGFDLDAVAVIHHNTTVSLQEVLSAQRIGLYPNPAAAAQPLIIFNIPQQDVQVRLYDMMGKETADHSYVRSGDQLLLTVAQPGIYQLVLQQNGASVSRKLIIR